MSDTELAKNTSFEHLAGLSAARGKKADDDEDAKKAKKADDDAAKAEAEAAAKADADAKAKKHDDNEDDEDDEDDDEEDDASKSKKSKRGKKAITPAQARTAERNRCKSILTSFAAKNNIQAAATLAFTTDMSADAAVALLNTLPQSSATTQVVKNELNEQMANVPNPNIGVGDAADHAETSATLGDKVIAMHRMLRGNK